MTDHMTDHEQPSLRTLLIDPGNESPASIPVSRLLTELGHDLRAVGTLEEAEDYMSNGERHDLLVFDSREDGRLDRLFDLLRPMPKSAMPREIVVFADADRTPDLTLHAKGITPRVTTFIRPLHIHGLLSIVRKLAGRSRRMQAC